MAEKQGRKTRKTSREEKTEPGAPGLKKVSLTFYAPEGAAVFLAGEFNQWDTRLLPMKKGKDGTWKAELVLAPGRYEYKLFMDDAWVEDLPSAENVTNRFGTKNFILQVG